jgi:hypothetical protein
MRNWNSVLIDRTVSGTNTEILPEMPLSVKDVLQFTMPLKFTKLVAIWSDKQGTKEALLQQLPQFQADHHLLEVMELHLPQFQVGEHLKAHLEDHALVELELLDHP